LLFRPGNRGLKIGSIQVSSDDLKRVDSNLGFSIRSANVKMRRHMIVCVEATSHSTERDEPWHGVMGDS